MNIREAAAQLAQTVRAYAAKTPEGAYRVPLAAQRPVYLIGPPGVGKTAAVAQTARALGIGFAAYTMTHHTRQSALGLPLIVHRTLNGEDCAVTEYTVSEIVADVWAKAESGAETGILFLDEINCVSESLMPAMLQLLQYKTFGVHALPRGWMIVCAGNPPRYNRYAHTFDAVVMDRLRVIEVEPDFAAWQGYMAGHGAHPLVRSYLTLRSEDFYVSDGDRMVTARSWTDLSDMMLALEAEDIAPEEALFGQYLQVETVAGRFGMYARLCADVGARLDEAVESGALPRALPFDEGVFAALFLAERLARMAGEAAQTSRRAEKLTQFVEGVAREAAGDSSVEAVCQAHLQRRKNALEARARAGIVDEDQRLTEEALLSDLEALAAEAHGEAGGEALERLRQRASSDQAGAEATNAGLEVAFSRYLNFSERAFDDPNVRLIFLNALRDDETTWRFIRTRLRPRFDALWAGCDPETRKNGELI